MGSTDHTSIAISSAIRAAIAITTHPRVPRLIPSNPQIDMFNQVCIRHARLLASQRQRYRRLQTKRR